MMRLVFAVAAVLIGAVPAPANEVVQPLQPFLYPELGTKTYYFAPVLPLARVAGRPAALTVEALQSISEPNPRPGASCGLQPYDSRDTTDGRPGTTAGGSRVWVVVAAGGAAVGGLGLLGLWLLRRNRAA